MTRQDTAVAAVILAIIMVSASRPIMRGMSDFKTFLSMRVLLNPCDGVGSPPPCH